MREFFRRIYYLLNRRRLERELANDIQVHREMMGEESKKDFGNALRVQEQAREAWGWSWLDHLFQDVRYGFRMLRKNPGFTTVAIAALALGIGANTALFSVVYGVLLKPLPYAQGQDLVVLHQEFSKGNKQNIFFSVKEINDYRQQSKALAEVEEYHQMGFILLDGQEPMQVRTGVVSAHFFDLLGLKPYVGRFFYDSDDKPDADPVLVLSYNYWMTHYGGDRGIIGRHFRMNDKVHTVIGVLPPIPQYPRENDVYMPTVACPYRSSPMMIESRDDHMMRLFGRLKPGTSVQAGVTDVSSIASRLGQTYPESYPAARGFTAGMDQLQQQLTQQVRPMLWILLTTAGMVLLIACANVANLTLARTMRREQELAVRAAMGANRGRLVRQLLTESTLLSLAGGALGLVLASTCLDLLVKFVSRFTTRAAEVSISTPVLIFTLVVSILTGLAFGSVPAFFQRLDLIHSLKEGSSSSVKANRNTVRNVLVMGQVAMSFFVLIVAGLMVRSFIKLQQVKAGYNAENVLTADIPLNFSKYKGDKEIRIFFDRLEQRLQGAPGVQAVAVTAPPLSPGYKPGNQPFVIEGKPVLDKASRPVADTTIASPDAFGLLGIPLLRGRLFTRSDTEKNPVVVINRSLERRYFPNEDPIGKRISGDDGKHWATIIGIAGDVRQYGLAQEPVETVYVPFALDAMMSSILVKTSDDPLNHVRQLREAVYAIDPEQPTTNMKTLSELRGDSMAQTRLTSILLLLFGGLALAIAATGLAGVTALLVSQRTREIGIRLALGAQRTNVLNLFVLQAMKVIAVGLATGIVVALLGSRLIQTLLFSTPPTDPLTFLGVALTFVAVALVASYIPARRVTKVSPLIALRSE
ncbi:MAG TPA: ABC transporter permease [Candidatus Angelobacter sp.]